MRIGRTKAATSTASTRPAAWGAAATRAAMTAALTAKLVAQTPVSTTLMCMNIGVSQYSRGATRFANATVNGRPTTIDAAAATASVAGARAGMKVWTGLAGSATASTESP